MTENYKKIDNKTKFAEETFYSKVNTNESESKKKQRGSIGATTNNSTFYRTDSDKFLKQMNLNLSMNNFNKNTKFTLDSGNSKDHIMQLQDQIVLFKTYFNKKEKEFYQMKILNQKLEEENKKNLKVISKILNNVNLQRHVAENTNDRFLMQDLDKMKETYVMNSLKLEIHKLKEIIYQKDLMIEELKKSEKVQKLSNLQEEHKKKCDDFMLLDHKFTELNKKFNTIKETFDSMQSERDALRASIKNYKTINDDLKNKLKFYQNETSSSYFIQEELRVMQNIDMYTKKNLKNRIKQLEDEKESNKTKIIEFENFNKEKSDLKYQIDILTKKYNFAIFEKEQLAKKFKMIGQDPKLINLNNENQNQSIGHNNPNKLTSLKANQNNVNKKEVNSNNIISSEIEKEKLSKENSKNSIDLQKTEI